MEDLRSLVEPATRGDPEAPLLWTAKSLRHLAAGLQVLGHRIGHNVVGDLLRGMGYSLQANRKTREGSNHPDCDAQFGYINQQVTATLAAGERRSRSTPRRRSWSATSRTPAGNIARSASLSRCACTTS